MDDSLAKQPWLKAAEAEQLRRRFDWSRNARTPQLLPPGDWTDWLILAGRGFGKTRTLAETVRLWVSQGEQYVNLMGATADDARDVIVEGESGIMAICPDVERPQYKKSERKLVWPNGATSLIFTADEPDRLRGKQHSKLACDELAAWRYPDAFVQARLGLRLGKKPQCVIATTPRPTALIRELLAATSTRVTRGSTYDNAANLAPTFVTQIVKRYEGTRLGRQELEGELLTDTPGALWRLEQFDVARVPTLPAGVDLRRIVVAVDPAVSARAESDETGIVVAGLGSDGLAYVLADYSGRYSPGEWAALVARVYAEHRADCVVVEVNQGGDLVTANLRSANAYLPIRAIHAARGKVVRAEPVSALYEQTRVRHLPGLTKLEDQLATWSPAESDRSPDRLDALVYAITELVINGGGGPSGLDSFTVGRRRI